MVVKRRLVVNDSTGCQRTRVGKFWYHSCVNLAGGLPFLRRRPAAGTVGSVGAGFVGYRSAIVIDEFAMVLCYFSVVWKRRMGYDALLNVARIHGLGSLVGTLTAGLFASRVITRPLELRGCFWECSAVLDSGHDRGWGGSVSHGRYLDRSEGR